MSHPGVAAHGVIQPLFESWPLDPWVAAPLALAAGIYVRGWLRLHAQVPQRFGAGRLAAFLGGLAAVGVALESPLHALGGQLLQAHMVQHLLLMMVAPPLLWLGAPLLPMLQGLPRGILRPWVGALFVWSPLTHLAQWLIHPPVAWVLFVGSTWAWHTPALYGQALASEVWHYVQHACFLATALAFWWPVVQPWPSRQQVPPWAIVLYLMLADLQNTVLSAWLVFSERLVYSAYNAVPHPWQISALDDQAAAGAIMWVPGSIAFLFPVAWIVGQMLSPQRRPRYAHTGHDPVRLSSQQVVDDHLRLGYRHEGETW
jgi:cytochrome c oxidase assembly factor CtaG